LLEYLLKIFDHVSFEQVCSGIGSGIGIPHLYRYVRDVEHIEEKSGVAKLVDSAGDPSVVIINRAMDPNNPKKVETNGVYVLLRAASVLVLVTSTRHPSKTFNELRWTTKNKPE